MSNYIDISKQQRVVFVDNIPYSEAERLSNAYPFALILTSPPTENPKNEDIGIHTIWRAGKCYSYISKVDQTPITIDTYSISLKFDAGCLSLNIGSKIGDFDIIAYESNSEFSDSNPTLYNNTRITFKNTGEIYFNLWEVKEDSTRNPLTEYNQRGLDNLLSFKLKLNDEYIDIDSYIEDIHSVEYDSSLYNNNIKGIKYCFNVKEELSGDLKLEVSYKLTLTEDPIIKEYPIELQKTVADELIWIGSNAFPINVNSLNDNEITRETIESDANWYYINEFNYNTNENQNPLQISEGHIRVIIPENYTLYVDLKEEGNGSSRYVKDVGDDNTYSYRIFGSCKINGKNYKALLLQDESITEFINIIQHI